MAKTILLQNHLIALFVAQKLGTVKPITKATLFHLKRSGLIDAKGNVTAAGRAIDTEISP